MVSVSIDMYGRPPHPASYTQSKGCTENGVAQKRSMFKVGGFDIILFQVIIYNFCK